MTALDIETVADIEIFEQLEGLDDHVGCSYTDCDQTATSFLVCGEDSCDAAETICKEHTLVFLITQLHSTVARITFDNTCKHEPLIHMCEIRPMAK